MHFTNSEQLPSDCKRHTINGSTLSCIIFLSCLVAKPCAHLLSQQDFIGVAGFAARPNEINKTAMVET